MGGGEEKNKAREWKADRKGKREDNNKVDRGKGKKWGKGWGR